MGNDISPIALELLYSPGFFLVKEAAEAPQDIASKERIEVPANDAEAQAAPQLKEVLNVPVNLVFIVSEPQTLQPAEQQMLERMAGFIRSELRIGKEWLQGGPELWQQVPGNHYWVFFGNQHIPDEPEMFACVNHHRGPVLKLPAAQTLAPDAALKKQALEALKTWANQAL